MSITNLEQPQHPFLNQNPYLNIFNSNIQNCEQPTSINFALITDQLAWMINAQSQAFLKLTTFVGKIYDHQTETEEMMSYYVSNCKCSHLQEDLNEIQSNFKENQQKSQQLVQNFNTISLQTEKYGEGGGFIRQQEQKQPKNNFQNKNKEQKSLNVLNNLQNNIENQYLQNNNISQKTQNKIQIHEISSSSNSQNLQQQQNNSQSQSQDQNDYKQNQINNQQIEQNNSQINSQMEEEILEKNEKINKKEKEEQIQILKTQDINKNQDFQNSKNINKDINSSNSLEQEDIIKEKEKQISIQLLKKQKQQKESKNDLKKKQNVDSQVYQINQSVEPINLNIQLTQKECLVKPQKNNNKVQPAKKNFKKKQNNATTNEHQKNKQQPQKPTFDSIDTQMTQQYEEIFDKKNMLNIPPKRYKFGNIKEIDNFDEQRDQLSQSEKLDSNNQKNLIPNKIVKDDTTVQYKNLAKNDKKKIAFAKQGEAPERNKILNRKDREQLNGYDCQHCKDFFNAVCDEDGIINRDKFVNTCSHHRLQYSPPQSPTAYQDGDFGDDIDSQN